MAEDFYQLLGVERDADAKTLKSAYRRQVMKYHPDRNPGDAAAEEKFKSVSRAYEILSDPEKRAAYDRFGHSAFEKGRTGAGAASGFSSRRPEDILSEVFGSAFSDFFGTGQGRGGASSRGDDLRHDCRICLEDAFTGKSVTIAFRGKTSCETCSGSGAEPGSSVETCSTCGGVGRVRAQQGFFTMEHTCPSCRGAGRTIGEHCHACHGQGVVSRRREVRISIPAGIEDGQRIRLSGKGDAGAADGQPGDLYVFVTVDQHDIFERDGSDLIARASIPMVQAAIGGSFEMPTIDGGKAHVKIPAGTQTGKRLRLAGKGMPVLRGHGRGDLYVQVGVETPRSLTPRQRELLQEFDSESQGESHPDSTSFLKKVKSFFEHGREQ